MQHGLGLEIDRDLAGNAAFAEIAVEVHKTSAAKAHRHQFLPMAAPALGVFDRPWLDDLIFPERPSH